MNKNTSHQQDNILNTTFYMEKIEIHLFYSHFSECCLFTNTKSQTLLDLVITLDELESRGVEKIKYICMAQKQFNNRKCICFEMYIGHACFHP